MNSSSRSKTLVALGGVVLLAAAFALAAASPPLPPPLAGGEYDPPAACLAGGNTKISGNMTVSGSRGHLHANGTLEISGNPVISGDATCTGTLTVSGNPVVGGTLAGNQPARTIPAVDPENWRRYANFILKADGRVLDPQGGLVFDGSTGLPFNGWKFTGAAGWEHVNDTLSASATYFFETSVKIGDSPGTEILPVEMTLIATGSIEVSGGPFVCRRLPDVALVAGGDLKISGQANWKSCCPGLFAAREQILIGGNAQLRGAIVAENAASASSLVAGLALEINSPVQATYDGGLRTRVFTGPPPPPAIASPAHGAFLADSTPTVSGTSDAPDLEIRVYVDGVHNGTATTGTTGAWSLDLPTPIPDGAHTLTATAANPSFTSGPSAAVSITIDTAAPSAPGQPSASPNPNNTGAHTLTWAAATDPGGSGVDVYELERSSNAGATFAPVATVAATSFTEPGIAEGTYVYRVRAKDRAGNAGPHSPNSAAVVVDKTSPAAPAALGQFRADGTTSIPVGGSTTETAVVLKGTVADVGLVTTAVKLQVEVKPTSTAFDGTGLQESGFVASGTQVAITVSNLAAGGYHWRARAHDQAGNPGPFLSFGGNADGQADFVVVTSDVTPPSLTLSPADGEKTEDNTPTLTANYSDTGSGVNTATFKAFLDGADVTSSFTVGPSQATFTPASPLSDGAHTFAAEIRDNAGNLAQRTSVFHVCSAIASIGPGGGTMEVLDSARPAYRTRAEFPPGAVSSTTTFCIEHVAVPFAFPPGYASVGPVVTFHPSATFAAPVRLCLPYDESLVTSTGVPELGLKVIRYDGALGLCVLVPVVSIDTVNNLVCIDVTAFSGQQFGVAAQLVHAGRSEATATPRELPADGQSTSTLTIIPMDVEGRLLGPRQAVSLTYTGAAAIGAVKDVGNGVYRATATSVAVNTVTVTVTVNGVVLAAQPTIAFTKPFPDSLSIDDGIPTNGVGFPDPLVAGAAKDMEITAKLSGGAVLESFVGVVRIDLTGTRDAAGTLIFPETFYAAFSRLDNGVLKLPGALVFARSGAQKITATVILAPNVVGEATVTVIPGAPADLAKLGGDGQKGAVDTILPQPLSVRLRDAFGNPIPGALIDFAVIGGGATLVGGSPTVSTDSEGRAACPSVRLPATEGTSTITASATSLAVLSFTVTAVPAADAPATPIIASPTDGSTVGTATPQVSGTGPDGLVLRVLADGFQVGETSVLAGGNWSVVTTSLSSGCAGTLGVRHGSGIV